MTKSEHYMLMKLLSWKLGWSGKEQYHNDLWLDNSRVATYWFYMDSYKNTRRIIVKEDICINEVFCLLLDC